ncbi:hypothetical protein ACFKIX_000440 [Vibrio alginolyticus]
MPELGISEFSSIAVTTGKPKITKIRKIATRGPYQHFKDYYLHLRNAIKSLFTQKRHISYLFEVARKQKNDSKKVNYEKIANNFKEWQSGKNIAAYIPQRGHYTYQQTSINCNPELNVSVNGNPTLVKLHFSTSDKMTQERANYICHLLADTVGNETYNYAVLDLTTGKEYSFKGNPEQMSDRITNEIETIQGHWTYP